MKYYINFFLCFALFASIASAQVPYEFEQDKEDIIAAVKGEVKAYFEQDYDTFINYWIQTPEQMYVSNTGGHYYTILGWKLFDKGIIGDFEKDINPNLVVNKTNFDILTDGNSAFLTFDVISKLKNENELKIDSVKCYSIMVKDDRAWKFIYMHQANNTDYDPALITTIQNLNWTAWTLAEKQKDYDSTFKILRISRKLDPDYEGTHYISARIFENINENERALKHWNKIQRKPQALNTMHSDLLLDNLMVTGITLGMPGISVAIGTGDSIIWTGTAGYSDLLKRIPVKENDRFCVGSISKTFTARVILQLVEEGKLDLDKKPTDYLDAKIVHEIANTDKATLRQLLNHQSGIPTWEFQSDWIRKGRGDQMELSHVWGKTETLEYATNDLLDAPFSPGEQYSYSNTNYTILGLVIEAVTGNDAAEEIRSRLLEPLDLNDTFLESFEEIPDGYVSHYHYATPHFIRSAGIHGEFTEIRPYVIESTAANLSPEWTAGGIVSSASDLVRWAQSIRDGELLGEEMQNETFTYYPPATLPRGNTKYMQGISMVGDFIQGHSAYGHSGATLGFTAFMYWIEDTDIIVVMLTNIGLMHSGLAPSPPGIFYNKILIPAVMQYLGQ